MLITLSCRMQINKTRRPREFPKAAVSRGCFTRGAFRTHARRKRAWHSPKATAQNSRKSKVKLSVWKRKHALPPHPFCANSPCHLVAKDTKWETTRRAEAGSPLIHSNEGCVPYCLSLSLRTLSSNSVKQLALCASGCGNWRQRAPSQRESAGANKDDENLSLAMAGVCEWGHRGWNAAASAAAAADRAS